MRSFRLLAVAIALAAGLLCGCSRPLKSSPPPVRIPASADLGAMQWRWVGPAQMGGRLDVVQGVAGDPSTIYLGHSSGGLYKSTDGGLTFVSIFSQGTSSSIGALAVAPSNPSVVYAGTGEGFPRNTAAPGDGVFVSTNAGKTWRFSGLRKSEHIAKIAVDPRDANVAIVAALGPEFRPGGERGIYRTGDGGRTWQRVLYVNPTTGGSDVAFDPHNPQIAYAGTFDFLRTPWHFRGGGPGSGLYRSTDNGRTWQRLTDVALHDGLPGGIINRVGVSVCYDHPNVVYALVPTKHGMLYRSTDGGAHWTAVNGDAELDFRPFYFSQVRADPRNPNRVYVITGENQVSNNGGKTFTGFDGGGDNHDLWIDPTNPQRILAGSDMGFELSDNGGSTWNYDNVVPFDQVYRVGYDLDVPYHVMGGMQDHEVWWGPSTLWNGGEYGGVPGGDWRNISDWGDGQYAMADPSDPDIVYEDTHFGDLVRRNLRTGEARFISPQPMITFGTGVGSYRYRFSWSAPLLVSPRDSGVVFFGGNVLFKTSNGGTSWSVISPDLTQPCNPAWLGPSGGPISRDDTNAEAYCTIYALAQDARSAATLWAGTDNGNLWITRDGGAHWTNVIANVPGLPAHALVAAIDASRVTPGVAYVAFDRHELGDDRPYAYYTTDYGRTWTNVSRGLPAFVHVVREDPRQTNLLFAGTEQGVSVSFDRGAHWTSLMLGMAPVPVFDLRIQPVFDDLILGTHGRGFYILDDITPLEQLAQSPKNRPALFTPIPAWRYVERPTYETGRGAFVAQNKPYGAIVSYYLPRRAKKQRAPAVKLQILDARGAVLRTLHATTAPGINRVVWDLHTDPPGGPHAVQDPRTYYVFYFLRIEGPQVLPGTYTARLTVGSQAMEAPVTVRLDPSVRASAATLAAHYDAMERLAQLQEQGEVEVSTIAALERQIGARTAHLHDAAVRRTLAAYRAELDAAANELRTGNGSQNAGYKNPAALIDQIAYLRHTIPTSFQAPTGAQQQLMDLYAQDSGRIASQTQVLFGASLAPVNAALVRDRLQPLRAVTLQRLTHRANSR
jgi:photosystem II stability/assembly factor-like uncharacterized protein